MANMEGLWTTAALTEKCPCLPLLGSFWLFGDLLQGNLERQHKWSGLKSRDAKQKVAAASIGRGDALACLALFNWHKFWRRPGPHWVA